MTDLAFWGNQSIYLHRSGPLLENGLDKPQHCYGRNGFASFSSISMSTVGVDEPEFPSEDFLFLLSGWWWWWWMFLSSLALVVSRRSSRIQRTG